MYHAHFALDGIPFLNTPDTALFFPGSNRGAILQALIYAVDRGEGLVTVTGEVGSGKTMLCRMLAHSVDSNVQLIYLPNPMLSPDQAIRAIVGELGIRLGARADTVGAFEKLNAHLLKLHEQGRRAVLLVEEAQAMPRETLEQIRLLGNLETHRAKLLQVILFAQPELEETLAEKGMRQFRDRVSHAFNLAPLSCNELRDYLQFRLSPSKGAVESLFTVHAVRSIHTYSRGMIRRINLLADKSLLAAYARGASQVDTNDVRLAARDSAFIPSRWPRWLRTWLATSAFVAAVALPMLYAMYPQVGSINPLEAQAPVTTPSTASTETPLLHGMNTITTGESTPERLLLAAETAPIPNTAPTQNKIIPDMTAKRLAATQEWLTSVDPSRYTLQLMTSFLTQPNQLSGLEKLLQRDTVRTYADQLFLLPGRVGSEEVYVLSYAEFADYRSAQQAIEHIPREFSRFNPLIRTIASLRTELME